MARLLRVIVIVSIATTGSSNTQMPSAQSTGVKRPWLMMYAIMIVQYGVLTEDRRDEAWVVAAVPALEHHRMGEAAREEVHLVLVGS